MKITKSDLNKLMIEERKRMRSAQKESKFKSRTLSIYKNQIARAKEFNKQVEYTLDEFRSDVREALNKGKCHYCSDPITVTKFQCDHKEPVSRGGDFKRDNNAITCNSCNWQKGKMTDLEFQVFLAFINKTFPPEIVKDIKTRLSSGGKWMKTSR